MVKTKLKLKVSAPKIWLDDEDMDDFSEENEHRKKKQEKRYKHGGHRR